MCGYAHLFMSRMKTSGKMTHPYLIRARCVLLVDFLVLVAARKQQVFAHTFNQFKEMRSVFRA